MLTLLKSGWFKVLALALLVLALYMLQQHIYQQGYAAGQSSVEKKWSQQNANLQARNQALTVQVANLQRTVDTHALEFERTSHEKQQAIIDDYERRMAAVSNSTERVYIPAKCPPMPAAGNPAGAAAAGPAARHGQARAELDQTVVADLTGITRDGDTCIVQLNEMIDRYHAAQAALAQLQQQQGTRP